jgi:predicted Zn-dependent protease
MNKHSPLERFISSFILSLMLVSCSSKLQSTAQQKRTHDYQLNRTLSDRCGEIASGSSSRVIEFLSTRLIAAANRITPLRYPVKLKFVACSEPLAFSLGAGSIIFSQGLVKKLPFESQLAFVLAHELGHEALGHLEQLPENLSSETPIETSQRLEQEADQFALKVLIVAGYDPRSSMSTIEALMDTKTADLALGGYPSLRSRQEVLVHFLNASQWQEPGIINRRDYNKLRSELMQNR